jgi:hypothetical protein
MTIVNLVILSIFDYTVDVLDSTVDFTADPANKDHIFARLTTYFSPDFDGQSFVLANDTMVIISMNYIASALHSRVQRCTGFANNSIMPLFVNDNRLTFDISSVTSHLR